MAGVERSMGGRGRAVLVIHGEWEVYWSWDKVKGIRELIVIGLYG